jgi:hypothetical protein
MQASQGLRQAFIIPSQTIDDSPTGQQDESMLGLRQFHHLELDTLGRRLGGLVAGTTLINS